MEIRRRFAIAFFYSALACLCHGLESDSKSLETDLKELHSGFDSDSGRSPFKTWGYGQPFPESPNANLQGWKDWMSKRSFGSTTFNDFDAPNFASWKNWMDRKRNFNPEGALSDIGQIDRSQFQGWSDWINKRGLAPKSRLFGNNPFENGFQRLHLQSWSDLAKRGYFGTNFEEFGNNDQMQSWHDWMKRSMGGNGDRPSGVPFGEHHYFPTHDETSMGTKNKRQFKTKPLGFGTFRQYFTDGLQDWRSSFLESKRAKGNGKGQKN